MRRASDQPFAISSNFAREHSTEVAFAASMGWISNIDPEGISYSRQWRPTAEGLLALRHHLEL